MSDSMRPSIREEIAEQQATLDALQRENAQLRERIAELEAEKYQEHLEHSIEWAKSEADYDCTCEFCEEYRRRPRKEEA